MTSRDVRRWWWAILIAAIVLRVALYGGYGLGDDPNYYTSYHDILKTGQWRPDRAYDWRFAFWVPVVTFMRVFGVKEWAFVGFITLCGVVNVALVYALARQDWDEPWAPLVAMALMAVLPLEVLSSTLFVIDIPLATYCYAGLWLYGEARTERRSVRIRIATAVLAGVFLFLGYSAKQWGILVGSIFALEALGRVRATWRYSLACGGTFLLLIGAYLGWQWWRFGDPIKDVHVVRSVAIFLPHSWDIVTDYSRMLLFRTEYGSWLGGWYVQATLVLAVLFLHRLLRAGKWLFFFIIQLASLSAMPSHWENGHWVLLVPHIFRYLCFLSIPLCLALAAYWREAIRWRPALGSAALGVFLAITLAQAIQLTAPTRDAFGEQRRANALLLARFPDERYASDFGFLSRLQDFDFDGMGWNRFQLLRAENPAAQAKELASIKEAVVVTGGARLPWYGCTVCGISTAQFQPTPTWQLMVSFDQAPMTRYRLEPLRIWRVSEGARHAGELLQGVDSAPARLDVLRRLLSQGDYATAIEVGRRLALDGDQPRRDVGFLTGIACARTNRPLCAADQLGEAADDGLDATGMHEAVIAMADAAYTAGDFATGPAWLSRYRQRFPTVHLDPALADIASGISEGIARYHRLQYAEAERIFTAIRGREDEDPARRQRAHYFQALTLFREGKLDRALAETAAYRDRYGEDPMWIELQFRNAEVRRGAEPEEARRLFGEVATRYPESVWGREAQKILAGG